MKEQEYWVHSTFYEIGELENKHHPFNFHKKIKDAVGT